MKKTMLLLTSLALVGAITFTSSCKKKDTDSSAPTLVMDEPADDDTVVVVGDSLHIEGTVTDASLHELNIKVTKNSTGATLYNQDPMVHDLTTYFYHYHFAPKASDTGACTLTVTVSDHSEHTISKTAAFKVIP